MRSSRHDHFPRADAERRGRMRAAATALESRWQAADHAPGGLLAAIDAVADAPAEVAIAALMPWLADTRWLAARLGEAAALLAADPFARPPLRPVGDGAGAGGLILAERGAVRLSLQLHPVERGGGPAATALFIPGAAAIRILAAGGASLHRHNAALTPAEAHGAFTAAGAAPCRSAPPRPLAADEMLVLDTARDSFTLSGATGDVLLLELAVQPPSPIPIRSYDLATGRLVRVSASRRDSSFRQMALALLRTFGRTDAAPLFAAETQAEDFAARWSAMREFVALDPAAAHPHLARMAAADPHPEIRHAAKATLALYKTPPASGRGSETCQLAG